MTTSASATAYFGDPYRRQSPQRLIVGSKSQLETVFAPWRKHQKTHSSISLNTAYARRHSLESLSGGSLRNATFGSRSLRWKFLTQQPMIQKLSTAAHFHYDFVELGPIKVEVLPPSADDCAESNDQKCNQPIYQQPTGLPPALPALFEHCADLYQRESSGGRDNLDQPGWPVKEGDSRVGAGVFEDQSGLATDCVTGRTGWSTKISCYVLRVHSNQQTWTIRRTYDDFVEFDKQLHRCVYDRRFSLLNELPSSSSSPSDDQATFAMLCHYVDRLSDLAGSLITCFPVLKWLELDNRGNHLITAEETQINTPAVAAAYVVQNYSATATDELTLKVGDIVSVIDMPPASESIWWRGKLTILKTQYADGGDEKRHKLDVSMSPGAHFVVQVGLFPSYCVQLFGNRLCGSLPGVLNSGGTLSRPVFRRRGKWASFLRMFLANRPSRRILKEAGILKERVFGCDLAEHLESAGLDVPIVLRNCANVIETCGIVDGIYRGSGVLSNIQRLRNAFDENRVPNLLLQDVHCVASVLKMYFRELPNPLLTYQLYSSFIAAVEGSDSSSKILRLHNVVQQLPPPHFRTAEYLIRHLMRVAEHGHRTGMHYPNLALVWSPNLLRSKELENMENTGAVLRNVNTQAVVVEYLIRYGDIIFSRKMPTFSTSTRGTVKRQPRPMSLACSSSLPSSPSRLMTLEEAKLKLIACQKEKVPADAGLPDLSHRKCIDLTSNGGSSSVPPKYHTVIQLPRSKMVKTVHIGNNSVGSWRSLFHGWRNVQDNEEQSSKMKLERYPPSPVIGSPTLITVTTMTSRERIMDTSKEEDQCDNRKQLYHTRSAENIQAVSTGAECFISLDNSIRDTTSRRSFRTSKRHSSKNGQSQKPPLSVHNATPNASNSTAVSSCVEMSSNDARSLKSCRTTDIDRALSKVITVDSPPTVLPLRYENDNADITGPVTYLELTLTASPSSPVSEPETCSTEWIKMMHSDRTPQIGSNLDEMVEIQFRKGSSDGRKANSAPSSLRRIIGRTNGEGIMAVSGTRVIPTRLDVSSSGECESAGATVEVQLIEATERGPSKELSKSEEKLLLEQLSQTPPDESPSQDDLRNLFPELNRIYHSLSDGPVVEEDMAASIADLEVIETQPEWRSPSRVTENGSTVNDGDAQSSLVETTGEDESKFDRKSWKDAATSPVTPTTPGRPKSYCCVDTCVSPAVERDLDLNGLLRGQGEMRANIGVQENEEKREDGGRMRFISFNEANAVFDRRETLQTVQSSRRDSEEEDSVFLDSIYDNLQSSPSKGKQQKPVPRPRTSKMKVSTGSSATKAGKEDDEKESALGMMGKQARPVALAVTSGDQRKSSSEEGELVNSPLFRKQQQHLFLLVDNGRIKSEPPFADESSSSGRDVVRRRVSGSGTPEGGERERPVRRDGKGCGGVLAPSPRSAFTPVVPKCNNSRVNTADVSNNCGDSTEGQQQLHSILSTSITKKSASVKSKSAHVYFV